MNDGKRSKRTFKKPQLDTNGVMQEVKGPPKQCVCMGNGEKPNTGTNSRLYKSCFTNTQVVGLAVFWVVFFWVLIGCIADLIKPLQIAEVFSFLARPSALFLFVCFSALMGFVFYITTITPMIPPPPAVVKPPND